VGDVSKQQERWNTHSFNRITFVKFKIVYWLADLGFTSLYTDGDIVFLCDIITKTMEIVDQFDRADIVMQNESRFSDEDMTNFCTGFFVSKPTSAVLQVFHPSNYEMVLDKNDQDLFNESMRQRLVIVGLPRKLFPHGKIISEQPVP
jgi:lipopolysaccharide biosynthesis glycosyltransferase